MALEQQPRRLRTLRGIDICGVERWQPLWVSAVTLSRLRQESRRIAEHRSELRIEPLRLTIHAGEDFRWLTSGVRAVAEPFHWSLIERGDRLGHGIAVTLDPSDWWKTHRGEVVEVSTFDRLLDLAFLAKYAEDRSPDQTEWLRLEIETVARNLSFLKQGRGVDVVKTAEAVWCHLGSALARRLAEMPTPVDGA